MADRTADEAASPGRQALVLLAGGVSGLFVATAAGAPFDIDVGAGDAIFHLVVALSGCAAFWVMRLSCRFAQWATMALTIVQLAESLQPSPMEPGIQRP